MEEMKAMAKRLQEGTLTAMDAEETVTQVRTESRCCWTPVLV